MKVELCPHCHQAIHFMRAGIMMTPLKAEIFDYIKQVPGQSRMQLANHFNKSYTTMGSHITQINELLTLTNVRIVGTKYYGYRISEGKRQSLIDLSMSYMARANPAIKHIVR